MMQLFNTPFEAALRVLMTLKTATPKKVSREYITAYDFITTYGAAFGIGDQNLHGINFFKFSEIAARREFMGSGIKLFVQYGFINVFTTSQGFLYSLTPQGEKYVNTLSSDYSSQYLDVSIKAQNKFKNKSLSELFKLIQERSIESLRS